MRDYTFILTAYDGQASGGGGVDKFRIKQGASVIYATMMGARDDIDMAISGGSIVIPGK